MRRCKASRLRASARERFSSGIVAYWADRTKHSLDGASRIVVQLGH